MQYTHLSRFQNGEYQKHSFKKYHFHMRCVNKLQQYEKHIVEASSIPEEIAQLGIIYVIHFKVIEPMIQMMTLDENGDSRKMTNNGKIEIKYRSYEDGFQFIHIIGQDELNNIFIRNLPIEEEIALKLEFERFIK